MTAVRVMTHPFQRSLERSRAVEVLPPVELTTDRLCFRPLVLADRSAVLAALARSRDELVARIPLNRAGEDDRDLFQRWVDTAIECDNNRTAWRRAAFLDDGSFVGLFNLIRIETGLEWTCEANWWVDARWSGRGLASEGVEALMELATGEMPVGLGLSRVVAMIQPDNRASVRIAEKAGMVPAGYDEPLSINGVRRTHLAYERRA